MNSEPSPEGARYHTDLAAMHSLDDIPFSNPVIPNSLSEKSQASTRRIVKPELTIQAARYWNTSTPHPSPAVMMGNPGLQPVAEKPKNTWQKFVMKISAVWRRFQGAWKQPTGRFK